MTARLAVIRLTLAGVDLGSKVDPRLKSWTLTEKGGGEADQLDLVLSDHDGRLAIPAKGAVLALAIGWLGQPLVDKGTFKVDEAEHAGSPDEVRICARSADLTAEFKKRRDGSWKQTTLGQVLADVAGRAGLELAIAPDLAAKPIEVLQQSRESDAALVKRLGKRFDAIATVKAGRLLFNPRGATTTPAGAAIPAAVLTRASGDSHTWKTTDREGGYTGVEARWHDTAAAQKQTVLAGSAGKVRRLKRTYGSEAEAREAAEAEQKRSNRKGATFSYTLALGRADLYPGRKVTVSGFKPEIDGPNWLIDQVVHQGGDSGFTTQLEMELA